MLWWPALLTELKLVVGLRAVRVEVLQHQIEVDNPFQLLGSLMVAYIQSHRPWETELLASSRDCCCCGTVHYDRDHHIRAQAIKKPSPTTIRNTDTLLIST